ncbi:hypothetical protein FOWG_17175 [Fusarium oxysporum f. sp. lycopersici MN25]|nr:hypothetical protein FOWG_17175 [Fusarium oxysporum f. sp. lycopersici MN25]
MTAANLQPEPCSAIYPYVLLSTYRLLVCQICGFASVADEVATHLRTRHRDIQPEHRQGLVEKINQITNIIRKQDELRDLQYPTNTIEPIPFLAPPKPDGLKCRVCGHIVRRLQKMQKHCAEKHQWINPRGRGRPVPNCHASADDPPWEEHVACQRFFPSRAGSRWFQVNVQTLPQTDVHKRMHTNSFQSRVEPRELDQASFSHLSEVIKREQTYWETVNQPRLSSKDMDNGSFATTSIWMERTRWQYIYKGARRDILRSSTRLPDRRALAIDRFLGQGNQESDPNIISSSEAEQKISCILDALDIVLDRCEDTISRTSRFLLCWLNSTKYQHFYEKPFSLVAEKSTEKKYRNVQKRLLAFAFRTHMMTARLRKDCMRFQLSEYLSSQLQVIWEHKVWQSFDWSSGCWPMVPSGNEIGEAVDEASVHPEYHLLQEEIIPANASQSEDVDSEQDEEEAYSDEEDEDTDSVFSYDEADRKNSEFADNQAEADRSHHGNYSMMRDESNKATFMEFLELLYQLCLTISTERFTEGRPSSTLLVFFSGILGFSQDCKHFLLARQFCPYLSGLIYIQRLILMERALPLREYRTIGIPQRSYVNQLDQLNSIREKYMIAGTQYPLAEMTSLRDFGRNIARTEPPSILFSWSDDGEIIRYGDFQLTMDKFRQIPDYFISRAEEICDKLMFNIKPDIDLAAIKDDMVNTSSGYSFVKHPANDLDKAYLDLLYSAYASRETSCKAGGDACWGPLHSVWSNSASA